MHPVLIFYVRKTQHKPLHFLCFPIQPHSLKYKWPRACLFLPMCSQKQQLISPCLGEKDMAHWALKSFFFFSLLSLSLALTLALSAVWLAFKDCLLLSIFGKSSLCLAGFRKKKKQDVSGVRPLECNIISVFFFLRGWIAHISNLLQRFH